MTTASFACSRHTSAAMSRSILSTPCGEGHFQKGISTPFPLPCIASNWQSVIPGTEGRAGTGGLRTLTGTSPSAFPSRCRKSAHWKSEETIAGIPSWNSKSQEWWPQSSSHTSEKKPALRRPSSIQMSPCGWGRWKAVKTMIWVFLEEVTTRRWTRPVSSDV